MEILKNKPERDKKYLRNICRFGCSVENCGAPAIPHHLKGYKLGGLKVSDYLTLPLCDHHHSAPYETGIHNNIKRWEETHKKQPLIIIDVLYAAFVESWITENKMNKYIAFCQDLLKRFE